MQGMDRRILTLSDTDLERFVFDWLFQKKKSGSYCWVERLSSAGDMGRDVVGFLSQTKAAGPWDNYQCKQLKNPLDRSSGLLEAGKLFYYSHAGNFSLPSKYYYVAPNGITKPMLALLLDGARFRSELIANWDEVCSTKITAGKTTSLDAGLKALIEKTDFDMFEHFKLEHMLADQCIGPILHKWFGTDLEPAPKGKVPHAAQENETRYLEQLRSAYSEREGVDFPDTNTIIKHRQHGPHLHQQRERFFNAEEFCRHFRDQTETGTIEALQQQVFDGVSPILEGSHRDSLAAVNAVMGQAAAINVGGVLGKYTEISHRQGVCHQLANQDRLLWKKLT